MRTPLIAGNWKMNGSVAFTQQLLDGVLTQIETVTPAVEWAVFPPFVYLETCSQILQGKNVGWGAQTMSERSNGAVTGEISAAMLQDLGCSYVILGHSERRHFFHESNELIAAKVNVALQAQLHPILCVGETLEQRRLGKTLKIVKEQLAHVLRLKDNLAALRSMVIAYEPVWAIGTGETATPEQAEEVHATIRLCCNDAVSGLGEELRILYGGSVKPENAASLFAMPNIDGALVGGASLNADRFIKIGKQWNK